MGVGSDLAVILLFPLAGVWADIRRSGRAHPAWKWGIGAIVGSLLLTQAIAYSPVGLAIYDRVTEGYQVPRSRRSSSLRRRRDR